jgi:chaperone modulatory protein CbpM
VIGLDELMRRVAGLDRGEIVRWVENRWILPEQRDGGGGWRFREVDIARVELIRDIRHEFVVDDEAMPLVLSLIDQVYSLRRQLRRLCAALEAQPAAVRAAIREALPKTGDREP